MELRVLESVLAIAETGSFSRAAAKLGYSQSALTMQVKQLEEELQAQLFDRVPRGAVLTEEGRAFAAQAREVLESVERARASVGLGQGSWVADAGDLRVGNANGSQVGNAGGNGSWLPSAGALRTGAISAAEVTGRLRLGAVESVAAGILPELLERLHAIHPKVEMVLRTAPRVQLADAARENALDAFITLDRPFAAPGLERVTLREEEIVFVAAPSLLEQLGGSRAIAAQQPFSAGEDQREVSNGAEAVARKQSDSAVKIEDVSLNVSGSITPEQLVRLPLVLTERGESYRYELERLLDERDLYLAPIVEAASTDTLVRLAQAGVGATFLPRFCVERALEEGSLCQLNVDLEPIRMKLQLAHRKTRWPSRQLETFILLAEEFLVEE